MFFKTFCLVVFASCIMLSCSADKTANKVFEKKVYELSRTDSCLYDIDSSVLTSVENKTVIHFKILQLRSEGEKEKKFNKKIGEQYNKIEKALLDNGWVTGRMSNTLDPFNELNVNIGWQTRLDGKILTDEDYLEIFTKYRCQPPEFRCRFRFNSGWTKEENAKWILAIGKNLLGLMKMEV